MEQIFIFTAGNPEARQHLQTSILSPVQMSWLTEELGPQAEPIIERLPYSDGFYAWGAVPGDRNQPNWDDMAAGDVVLAVYDKAYHHAATVVAKVRSQSLARRIWGTDEQGKTWEFMYLLSPPVTFDVPVQDGPASPWLNAAYRGFFRISAEKVSALVAEFGSVSAFVRSVFGVKLGLATTQAELAEAEADAAAAAFDSSDDGDRRKRILAEIVRRRGQPQFRQKLLAAYQRQCAFTGCRSIDVLEAAHITPYRNENSNHVTNGLPLRADIHVLFDLGLLAVDDATLTVLVSPALNETDYASLRGQPLRTPSDAAMAPSAAALRRHRASTDL